MLKNLLTEKKDAICEGWREAIFASYPARTSRFFAREKGRFANPVGQTVADATAAIVDALIAATDADQLDAAQVRPQLERVIKVRAIQDFTPSEAVRFVYQLRDVLRDVLGTATRDAALAAALRRVEDRHVTQLALWAFDSYVACRERFHEVRIAELKRSVYTLRRRFGELEPDLPPAQAGEGAEPKGS